MQTKFEEMFLSILFRSKNVYKYYDMISVDDFSKTEYRKLYTLTMACFIRYNCNLTEVVLDTLLKEDNVSEKEIEQYKTIFTYINTFYTDEAQASFAIERIKQQTRFRDVSNTMSRSLDLYDQENFKEAERVLVAGVLNDIKPAGFKLSRTEVIEGFEERKIELEKRIANPDEYGTGILTGLKEIDQLTRGIWKSELGMLMGRTNAGKSLLALFIAKTAFLRGKKVLYIVEEMPHLQIATRFDSAISHVEFNKFKFGKMLPVEKGRWENRFSGDLKDRYNEGARFRITHMPTGCTLETIRAEIEYTKVNNGENIDLLIVDDIDMMEFPSSKFSDEQGQSHNARGLKGIAGDYNIPVWFTTQLATSAYEKSDMDAGDTGWAKRKVHVCDVALGLIRTKEDMAENRVCLQVVKYRDGVMSSKYTLAPDFANCLIHSEGVFAETQGIDVLEGIGEKVVIDEEEINGPV